MTEFRPNSEGIGGHVPPDEQQYAGRWRQRLPEAPKLLRDIAVDIEGRHFMSAVTLGLVADDIEQVRAVLVAGDDSTRERWALWFVQCADESTELPDSERDGLRVAAAHLRNRHVAEQVAAINLGPTEVTAARRPREEGAPVGEWSDEFEPWLRSQMANEEFRAAYVKAEREYDNEHCSCKTAQWVNDENWEPRWPGDQRQPGGAGRLPCGFCNHGGWDVSDPYEPPSVNQSCPECTGKSEGGHPWNLCGPHRKKFEAWKAAGKPGSPVPAAPRPTSSEETS